jgi:RNA polymerase primary sigma factor
LPVQKVETLLNLLPQVCSLDAPMGDPEHDALQAMLEDLHAPQPQEELVRKELQHTMDSLLGMLDARQQQVLRLHFGMEDDTCHSLEEIGKLLGISKERARQIERQAMNKLRTYGADLGLEDFLQ